MHTACRSDFHRVHLMFLYLLVENHRQYLPNLSHAVECIRVLLTFQSTVLYKLHTTFPNSLRERATTRREQ